MARIDIRKSRLRQSTAFAAPSKADAEAAVFTAILKHGTPDVVSTSEMLHQVRTQIPFCTLSDEEIVALIVQAAIARDSIVCFDHRTGSA
jgi:hypothetical protein